MNKLHILLLFKSTSFTTRMNNMKIHMFKQNCSRWRAQGCYSSEPFELTVTELLEREAGWLLERELVELVFPDPEEREAWGMSLRLLGSTNFSSTLVRFGESPIRSRSSWLVSSCSLSKGSTKPVLPTPESPASESAFLATDLLS